MNLAPLLSASPAIQLHAFAAMSAFALGIVQLAQRHARAPDARRDLGRDHIRGRDQLVFHSPAEGVGPVEPDSPIVDLHARDAAARRLARP